MNSWRMYGWSLVAMLAAYIFLSSCSVGPRIPKFSPLEPRTELPAGTGQAEAASFYRQKAAQYEAAAKTAEADAKAAKIAVRQDWCWWAGGASIVLGVVAFALAVAYPVAAFLRIGGVAAIAGGVATILLGEALPYFGLLGFLAVAAIIVSLVVQHRGLKNAVQSWKDSAEALPSSTRGFLDRDSLARQGPLVRALLSKHLRKSRKA